MKICPNMHIHAKVQEIWLLFDKIIGKNAFGPKKFTPKSGILGHIWLKFS